MSKTPNGNAVFYRFRSEWLDAVFQHHEVSHADFRVAYFIARRINANERSMWWQVKEIAKGAQCSTRTVSDATMKLERLGFLDVIRPARGVNSYRLVMPYFRHTQ